MKKVLLSSALFLSLGLQAMGVYTKGISSGGGMDRKYLAQRSVWFLGEDKSISYCIETSEKVPFTRDEYASFVESAFKLWSDYIVDRFERNFDGGNRVPKNLNRLNSCENVDLKIYFGKTNAAIETLKKQYVDPVAFTERTHFDLATAWSEGIIWFSEELLTKIDRENTRVAILHELGHIYNFDHTLETIMDEDNTYHRILAGKGLYKIDQENALISKFYSRILHNESFDGVINVDKREAQKTFELFTGRPPIGNVQAAFLFGKNKTAKLILSDKVFQFEKKVNLNYSADVYSSPYLKSPIIYTKGETSTLILDSTFSIKAAIQGKEGKTYTDCALNINMFPNTEHCKIPQEFLDKRESLSSPTLSIGCNIAGESIRVMERSAAFFHSCN